MKSHVRNLINIKSHNITSLISSLISVPSKELKFLSPTQQVVLGLSKKKKQVVLGKRSFDYIYFLITQYHIILNSQN